MFVNLSAVMLRLCEPFLDANSTKKDKINPKYVFYGSRLDFKELTALHASSEEVTEWLNKNNPNSASSSGQQSQYESTNYSFICECLFMTTRVLNLGLLKAFSDFKHLVQVIIQITKKPGRDIPIGLVGSMLIVITTYSLLATVLFLMQPYNQIDVDAPFTIAFEVVGMNWAKILVGLGALKGMTTVLLATIIAESRYFTHIARPNMAPPILAVVHKKLGTPVNAAIIMTAANCLVAFFTSLDVLASLLSISTLFIFSLVAIGLLVRRYYSTGVTTDGDRNKLIMLLVVIVSSSMGLALLWAWGVNSLAVYLIVVGIWFLSTLGIRLMVKQARNPRLWGAPLVPWLPSCSIALNLFMMGSIDGASFLRFMVWTMVLLAYYFLVGLHATYDASKETIKMEDDDEVERGNAGDRASTASEAVELNTITTSHT